jgi:hypothetical protein
MDTLLRIIIITNFLISIAPEAEDGKPTIKIAD